jgi:hypothetical protein
MSAESVPGRVLAERVVEREGGIVRPRALAVLRLIVNSNLVGSSTGRSAGFAPLRMRSM